MVRIVMKPERGASVRKRRRLYRAHADGKPTRALFRARNAEEADGMFRFLLNAHPEDKTFAFVMSNESERLGKEVRDAEEG